MRRRTSLAIGVAGFVLLGVSSCGGAPTTGDFRSEAETFIESDEFSDESGMNMEITDVECAEPADTEVNTTFACTGTGADGQTYAFDAQITGEREIAVAPGATGAPPSSTPASASTIPATTAAG